MTVKNLWYKLIRFYAHIGIVFYFKKIKVVGKGHIPVDRPVLFVANHRNGMIDPILIAVSIPHIFHFLTRASAFKNPLSDFLLRSINMLPIYRMRDGVDTLQKNKEIFETCYQVFANKGNVLIFPEGNHAFPRRVRPLSKGFTRIAFGFLDQFPERELYIVPVGLNYVNIKRPFRNASIHFGKPILVNQFYDLSDENRATEELKATVFNDLTQLTTHIADVERYDTIETQLKREGVDFTDPIVVNKRVKMLEKQDFKTFDSNNTNVPVKKKNVLQRLVTGLFIVNSIIPILIWQRVKPKIKDVVMLSTFRFGLSFGLIPIFYVLQAVLVTFIWNIQIGILYLIGSFGLVYLRKFLH